MSNNIFKAPCVNIDANKNYQNTVLDQVNLNNIPDSIQENYELDQESYPIWGTLVEPSWNKASPGDLILFYPESGNFKGIATILGTERSSEWGEKLWPNYEEEPWNLILLLENFNQIDLDLETFNKVFGYDKTNRPQGFSRVAPHRVKKLLKKLESFGDLKEAFIQGEVGSIIENQSGLSGEIKSYIEYYNKNDGEYNSEDAEKNSDIKDVFVDFRDQVWEIISSNELEEIFGIKEKNDLRVQYAGAGSSEKYPDWLWVYPSEAPSIYHGKLIPIVLISGKQQKNLKEADSVECFTGLSYKFKGSTKNAAKENLEALLNLHRKIESSSFYKSASSEKDKGEIWKKVNDTKKIKYKINNSPSSWPHFSLGLQQKLSLRSENDFLEDFESLLLESANYLKKAKPSNNQGTKKWDLQKSSLSEVIEKFSKYISSKGFYFEKEEIQNFILSLKTKPFVILAGISGTGKTKLATLFADFIHAEWKLISVKPNWTDNSDLLGYQDLSGSFRKKSITELLISANKEENRDKPHFAILDEMNLARVEHYFSDFLSKMETKKLRNGRLMSDRIFDEELVEDIEDGQELSDLRITDNFYFVGTVNMDETTHPFSRKVLDRANSLEFTEVSLNEIGNQENLDIEEIHLHNEVIKPKGIRLPRIYDEKIGFFDELIEKLERLNQILKKGDFQIGYRVRDEACIYIHHAVSDGIMEKEEAFDFQLKQKILPRLEGSTETISTVLKELHNFTIKGSDSFKKDWNNNRVIKERLSDFNEKDYVYPRSAKKILRMQRRYLEQTFTSFWI